MRPTPAQIEPVSARAYGCDPGAPVAPERRRVGDAVVLVGVLYGGPDSALAVERAGRVVTPPAHGYQPAAELRTVRRLARLQQHSLAGELPVALPDDEAGLRENGVAHEVEQHDEVAFSVRHQRREADGRVAAEVVVPAFSRVFVSSIGDVDLRPFDARHDLRSVVDRR